VPVFFMINGYLLLNRKTLPYSYAVKKIATILLVVFLWNFALFCAKFAFRGKIVNLFLLIYKSLLQGSFFSHFWFFGALICIYAVLPVSFRFFSSFNSAVRITLFFIGLSLCVDVLNIVLAINDQPIVQTHIKQTCRLWTWFAYYFLGGLLGKEECKKYCSAHIKKNWLPLFCVAATIVINVYQYSVSKCLYKASLAEYYYDNIFTFLWVSGIFLLVCSSTFPRSNAVISNLSSATMGMYIVHRAVITLVRLIFPAHTPIWNGIAVLSVFAASLLIALAISKIPVMNRMVKL